MSRVVDTRFATGPQFYNVLLRWMPEWASSTAEGRLVAGVIAQAWDDGIAWFFTTDCVHLHFYCRYTGLNPEHLQEMFRKYNKRYARSQGIV